jgi:hypothetical protein
MPTLRTERQPIIKHENTIKQTAYGIAAPPVPTMHIRNAVA